MPPKMIQAESEVNRHVAGALALRGLRPLGSPDRTAGHTKPSRLGMKIR